MIINFISSPLSHQAQLLHESRNKKREAWLLFYSPPLETKHISYVWRQALKQLASKNQHFSKLNFPTALRLTQYWFESQKYS